MTTNRRLLTIFVAIVSVWLAASGCIQGTEVCDPACTDGFRCSDGECLAIACTKACANGACEWSGETMVCACDPGYELQGEECVDVDECTDAGCGPGEICTNTAGGVVCNCVPGLFPVGEPGEGCTSPCMPSPCMNEGTCSVSAGGDAVCTCIGDWDGPTCEQQVASCDLSKCDDKDPCTIEFCAGSNCQSKAVTVRPSRSTQLRDAKVYLLCDGALNRQGAITECAELAPAGSHRLVRFETKTESQALMGLPEVGQLGQFWIGLGYDPASTEWVWGPVFPLPSAEADWCADNPKGTLSSTSGAVAGPCDGGLAQGWTSVETSSAVAHPFVCERECPTCDSPGNACPIEDCPPTSAGCTCRPIPAGVPQCAAVSGGNWCVPTCDPGQGAPLNNCPEGMSCKPDGVCGPAS